MFAKILVPVDPNEAAFSAEAVKTAAAMAGPATAIRLIAVLPVVGGYVAEFLPAEFQADMERESCAKLAGLAHEADLAPGRVSVATRIGSVYSEVVDDARDWGADLIVLTSHRPGMTTYLIGSNAARIVRHAPCSVLVVRQGG